MHRMLTMPPMSIVFFGLLTFLCAGTFDSLVSRDFWLSIYIPIIRRPGCG